MNIVSVDGRVHSPEYMAACGTRQSLPPGLQPINSAITFSAICGALLLSWITPGVNAIDAAEPPVLQQDLRNLARPRSLGLVALGIGGAALAHQWDDELRGDLSDAGPIQGLMDVGNTYGSTTYSLVATAGLWAVAHAADRRQLRPVASETLRALVLANIVVSPLKVGVARERPDGSNNFSFPSGHTANAFALTTVLTRRFGWRLGLPLYTLTAFVPAARIERDKHHFSDVVGGAVIGVVAGWAVTLSAGDHPTDDKRQVVVVPGAAPGCILLEATVAL